MLVNGPTVSRRRVIQATAAGWAAIAVAALARPAHAASDLSRVGDTWLPVSATSPVFAAAIPSLTASVLRRDDMLALRLEFYNLARSGMSLVRQVPGDPAYIVATLGYGADHAPQNIAEQAFPEPGPISAEPGDVDARLAGPTRLAFLVPATTTTIPYRLSTILGLFPGLKLNVAPAALPPGATPASPPALVDPGALETRIEAPWRSSCSRRTTARPGPTRQRPSPATGARSCGTPDCPRATRRAGAARDLDRRVRSRPTRRPTPTRS